MLRALILGMAVLVAVGGAAAGALVLVGMRQRRKSGGLRDTAEQLLRDLRP